jgi:predicted nucleic acid-binding protein
VRAVFVDTHFFVAFLNPRDRLHARAAAHARRLRGRARFVTSDFVLTELLNFFAEHGEAMRSAAVRIVEQWHASASVVVFPAVRAAFLEALRRYKERSDKGYSLTDCSSMLVMEGQGITEVLSHDEHFEQAGFRALLR